MKKRKSGFFLTVVLILFISIIFKLNSETITLATGEFPPLNSASLKHYGLVPRIVSEAFKQEGIFVEFQFYPWNRSYYLSANGAVDGTIQWLYSIERENDHFYSDPIMDEIVGWFHLKSTHFNWNTLADLEELLIGAFLGFTYTEEFYAAVDSGLLEVDFVSDAEILYQRLLRNRIDLMPRNIDVAYFELNSLYPAETVELFTYHELPFLVSQSHLLLTRKSDKSQRLLELFNSGLKKLKEKSLYDQYISESRDGLYIMENQNNK